MRSAAALLLACVLAVSACGGIVPVRSVEMPTVDGEPPLRIDLDDQAGIVASIEASEPHGGPWDGVTAVDGDPAAVRVSWTGGMCDANTTLSITALPTGIEVRQRTRMTGSSCLLAGVGRAVVLHLVEPIPADRFELVRDP